MNAVGTKHPLTTRMRVGEKHLKTHTLVSDSNVSIFELTNGNHSLYFYELGTDFNRLDIHPRSWVWKYATSNLVEVVDDILPYLYSQMRRVKPLVTAPEEYARVQGTRKFLSLRQSVETVNQLVGR